MFLKYSTYTKVKNILRTFEPDNHKMLRTSQPQKIFTGPYKKKVYKTSKCQNNATFSRKVSE